VDAIPELALRISNTESNVTTEIRRIEAFAEAARGRRVPRAAVGHLDTAAKESLRLDFFTEIIRRP
jgi:hypothetical protein